MTKKQQREIANDLLTGLRKYMRRRISKIPEEWDGIEIRQWITDMAAENIAHGDMSRQRKADYNNFRVVNNL